MLFPQTSLLEAGRQLHDGHTVWGGQSLATLPQVCRALSQEQQTLLLLVVRQEGGRRRRSWGRVVEGVVHKLLLEQAHGDRSGGGLDSVEALGGRKLGRFIFASQHIRGVLGPSVVLLCLEYKWFLYLSVLFVNLFSFFFQCILCKITHN